MSCSFNAKICLNCPKFNGCFFQIIYANTLSLAEMISNLEKNHQLITKSIEQFNLSNNLTKSDSIDMSLDLESLSSKIDKSISLLELNEENREETNIDISQIKNSISMIDLKIDDLIQKYEEIEYTYDVKE